MLLRLGINDRSASAEPRPETESPPFPVDPFSSLDEAIQQLAESESAFVEPALALEAAAIPAAVPEDVGEAVVYWLTHYSANPAWAARNIRELVAKAPERVVQTVLPLYQSGGWGEAGRFLATVLYSDGRMAAAKKEAGSSPPAHKKTFQYLDQKGTRLIANKTISTGRPAPTMTKPESKKTASFCPNGMRSIKDGLVT